VIVRATCQFRCWRLSTYEHASRVLPDFELTIPKNTLLEILEAKLLLSAGSDLYHFRPFGTIAAEDRLCVQGQSVSDLFEELNEMEVLALAAQDPSPAV